MVFQDPMTALSPVHSVATHMVDVLYRDRSRGLAAKRRAGDRDAAPGIPDPEDRIDHYEPVLGQDARASPSPWRS